MELNGNHRKWSTTGRRFTRMENILILCTTMCIFSLMMLLKIEMYKDVDGNSWGFDMESTGRTPAIKQMAMPAMKTIIAYSPEKQEEMNRKYTIACNAGIKMPEKYINEGTWQEVPIAGVSLYAAYYDDRVPDRPYLRILAVTKGAEETTPLYCQTWSQEDGIQSVEATVTPIWWKEWDPGSKNAITPLLISCTLTSPRTKTFQASISTSICEESVSNILTVKPNLMYEYTRNFTVCVKDMRFSDDISHRLVEWFELLKLLGADKVDIYVEKVPQSVKKVLDFYTKINFVNIRDAPRPSSNTLWQRRRDHLLAYNDCLYRNLKSSRYIVPLDVDEVIVPREDETWSSLLDKLTALEMKLPGAASLAVSNAFFFDSFEDEDNARKKHLTTSKDFRNLPHTLRHLKRSSLISPAPQYSKSFVLTAKTLTVFNHYALEALAGAERARAIPTNLALLHHYKATCRPALVDCHQYTVGTVRDDTLLRLADPLITNINKVLNTI